MEEDGEEEIWKQQQIIQETNFKSVYDFKQCGNKIQSMTQACMCGMKTSIHMYCGKQLG